MINNLNQDDNDDDQDDNKDNAPASALGWVPLSARSEVIDVAAWELWLLSIARHHYWPTWLCCTKAGSTWRREGPTGQGGGRHDGGDQEGGDGHPSALLEGSTSLDKKSASSRSFSHLFALFLIIFHTLAHSTTVSWFKCVSQGYKYNYQCYPSAPNTGHHRMCPFCMANKTTAGTTFAMKRGLISGSDMRLTLFLQKNNISSSSQAKPWHLVWPSVGWRSMAFKVLSISRQLIFLIFLSLLCSPLDSSSPPAVGAIFGEKCSLSAVILGYSEKSTQSPSVLHLYL